VSDQDDTVTQGLNNHMQKRYMLALIFLVFMPKAPDVAVAYDYETVSPKLIRGFDKPQGQIACLPEGAYLKKRITFCKKSVVKASLNGSQGLLITYTTPNGRTLSVFHKEWSDKSCSIYSNPSCPIHGRSGTSRFTTMESLKDQEIEGLTIISYYLEGIRIFSTVEDRG